MKSLGTAVVESYSNIFLYVDKVPDGVDNKCMMQNVSYAADTYISGCVSENIRGRGFLLQTKNAVITDCVFRNLSLPAILISPDFYYWNECGFVENLLIRNCEIENCNTLAENSSFGSVFIGAAHGLKDTIDVDFPGHGNISVIGCSFKNCPSFAVRRRGVKNFIFTDNTVTNCAGEVTE